MEVEGLDISLKVETLYLKLFFNRLAIDFNVMLSLSLERYYKLVYSEVASRYNSFLNVLLYCR